MFVIFDPTQRIFSQFMKAKDNQPTGDGSQHAGYLKRLKHMGSQALNGLLRKLKSSKNASALLESDTFIYVRGDESSHFHEERGSRDDRIRNYPAYGVDVPGACSLKFRSGNNQRNIRVDI